MNDQDTESGEHVTALNVQRLESGYFAHLESLRSQIPVGDYLLTENTMRWALISMAVVSGLILVLFPITMYIQFTPVVTLLYMVAFAGFAHFFYKRVLLPNEGTEEWRD